ncbi:MULTISPECIES: DHA2 family efflux MFS transporter permease subunit [Cobetia]|uniref:DHA2 family efflux MFS transporter permease subunit n=1 Tax=Cobetia TaxID=204286 RepID=UPI0020C6643B|nr:MULTISPECIES: DHA2 family efflux MFS transporter permease subunit [Cobetia]MDI4661578.1 DHA2 family efflux MFS transporter permease subunit [Cobetia sp. BMC6]
MAETTQSSAQPPRQTPRPPPAGTASDMPTRRQQIGFVAAVFGMFMAILDIQIVSSSLNELQAGLAASQDQISWVQTSYLIAEIVMIPLSGMLARIFSTRLVLTVSALGFTLASLGCALSTSLEALIVLRAVQGFMGGAMIPLTQAASFSIFPRRMMGSIQAVIGLVATMAPSIGPSVGGYITEYMSWHWLFLVNLVPGLIVATLVWRNLEIDRGDRGLLSRLDTPGLVLMAVFLGSLEFVLEEGPGDDWFASSLILFWSVVCTASAIGFFCRVLTTRNPIVDLRVFKDRNFALGAIIGFWIGVVLYGLVYLVPLFLGSISGFSSVQIGQVMFVSGVVMFLMAPVAGKLSDRIDLRLMLCIGLVLTGLGTGMNVHLTSDSGFDDFFWPQVIRGAGQIMVLLSVSRLAMGRLAPHEIGNGSGLFNVMRNLGGAVGLALIDTLRELREDYHWNQMIGAIDQSRQVVIDQLASYQSTFAGLADPWQAGVQMIAQRISIQAEVLAFDNIFLWLGAVYVLGSVAAFLFRRPENPASKADASESAEQSPAH